MRRLFLPFLLILSSPALAQAGEDAAHRADRLETERLNASAAAAVAQRDRQNAEVRRKNAAAQNHYQQELAAWRARVAACRSGQWSACD